MFLVFFVVSARQLGLRTIELVRYYGGGPNGSKTVNSSRASFEQTRANLSHPTIDWQHIDTVLLDMDGTLLDLNYDNVIWNQRLPEAYARTHGLSVTDSRHRLFTHMQALRGQLEFYCLEYWAHFTGLDIIELHETVAHLVQFRADAESFLSWLKRADVTAIIVTNAHPGSVAVKHRHTQLLDRVDQTVSCHSYGFPKESQHFWRALTQEHPFDPTRTLLIDDNTDVLSAAADYGIAHTLSVATPDSNGPARSDLAFPALDRFQDILPTRPAATHGG